MKDIILGIIYILIGAWLFIIDKVSLGYMSPFLEGFQKYLFVGLLVVFGLIQVKHGLKKNYSSDEYDE